MARHKAAAQSRRSPVKAVFGASRTKRTERERMRHDTTTRARWWKMSPQRSRRQQSGFFTARTQFLHLMGRVFRP